MPVCLSWVSSPTPPQPSLPNTSLYVICYAEMSFLLPSLHPTPNPSLLTPKHPYMQSVMPTCVAYSPQTTNVNDYLVCQRDHSSHFACRRALCNLSNTSAVPCRFLLRSRQERAQLVGFQSKRSNVCPSIVLAHLSGLLIQQGDCLN